jgi:hypothetical protein
MNACVVAEKWLYAALVADTTIHATVADRIYKAPAVAQPTYPCIVYDHAGGEPIASLGDSDSLQPVDMEVVLVAQTEDDTAIQTAADQLDVLLADVRATYGTTTTHVFRVTKTGEINEPAIEGTVRYLRLGGNYRFLYQGTA